jgi:apolipoprotein N-acyltransferase
MNVFRDNTESNTSINMQPDHLNWLWLLSGFLLLPFTMVQTVIPLAAWLAPVFLLRFTRTSRRALVAMPLIFAAYAFGVIIALRGSGSSSVGLFVFGLITFPLARGLMYTLPYAADRLIGARVSSWARVIVFPLAFTTV